MGVSSQTKKTSTGENTGRWTKEEHDLFLEGLKIHGKEWKKISAMICSRTVVQIRTHAQKYFQKLAKTHESQGREVPTDLVSTASHPRTMVRHDVDGNGVVSMGVRRRNVIPRRSAAVRRAAIEARNKRKTYLGGVGHHNNDSSNNSNDMHHHAYDEEERVRPTNNNDDFVLYGGEDLTDEDYTENGIDRKINRKKGTTTIIMNHKDINNHRPHVNVEDDDDGEEELERPDQDDTTLENNSVKNENMAGNEKGLVISLGNYKSNKKRKLDGTILPPLNVIKSRDAEDFKWLVSGMMGNLPSGSPTGVSDFEFYRGFGEEDFDDEEDCMQPTTDENNSNIAAVAAGSDSSSSSSSSAAVNRTTMDILSEEMTELCDSTTAARTMEEWMNSSDEGTTEENSIEGGDDDHLLHVDPTACCADDEEESTSSTRTSSLHCSTTTPSSIISQPELAEIGKYLFEENTTPIQNKRPKLMDFVI